MTMTPPFLTKQCDECNSIYDAHTSAMDALCPPGVPVLYVYPNDTHIIGEKDSLL
ncbi:hypothetical protein HX004_14495 [Myroides sp. 1354]|uniref:hypothetical protein n=1 Tax=unclassified Myroides TaxID=2642485 RepID=UPI002577B26D|nr:MULTISPECIES: hypothetical protein [unclassified Myroides]MDM1046036.1 hypothetical protein [Myroides sp. R163-1]MDM1056972.1 hypothetical protein [Myroides sp. 1354]MDM1070167.1 hypothetical protein [Myroides sp. 1372]